MTLQLLVGFCFFIIGIAYASFAEWALHRYVMHKPVKIMGFVFDYPFETHACVHHNRFKADESYEIGNHEEDVRRMNSQTIPMAWWNGPVIIAIATSPFFLTWLIGFSWIPIIAVGLSITLYYATYEYTHWCMHDPKNRWFESSKLYKWINKHHRLHHAYMGKNFNVVLPLADLCLGTLVLEVREKKPELVNH